VWQCEDSKKYFPVIIKSTSRKKDINSTNIWQGYWKQLSLYSYLLSKNSLDISSSGILLYLNASENFPTDLKKIDFEVLIFEKNLDLSWIETTLDKIFSMLNSNDVPHDNLNCKYCNYQTNIQEVLDGKL
jgi:CRISPR/Cas system-associated exonuclease Cas4 (RecB family)